MSLEGFQARHNQHIAAAGNSSASLDPHQQPHDANDLLIRGAGLAAAGKSLGLSEEETLAAVSREYRRQKRSDDSVTKRDVLRQLAQNAATLGTGEIDGIGYEDVSEIERAFGQDQSEMQNFSADDRGFTEDEETGLVRRSILADEKPIELGEFEGLRAGKDVYGNRYAYRRGYEEPLGYEGANAPKSPMRDALIQLQQGTDQFGYEAFPGSADVAGRLEDNIKENRGADASLGAETVRRDNERFNAEAQEANDFRAAAEADRIARDSYTVNGSGAMADEAIGRIAEIRQLGASGMAGHAISETSHVVRTANDAIKGQVSRRHDGIFLDPVTGDPIAIQGPDLPPVLAGDRTPNNGSSSNALNAPQTARDWMMSSMPDYRESKNSFGDYPQVDITLETTNFANRLREMQGFGMEGVSANIRSVEELQKVIDHVGRKAREQGKQLFRFDQETGRNVPSSNAGAAEVMNLMRMNEGDQQRLANAMFQMDASRRASISENPSGTYLSRTGEPTKGVTFGAGPSEAQAARIPKGSTIESGVTPTGQPKRVSIVKELANLESTDAQKPFIGQVAGEKPRINRQRPKNMGSGAELEANIQRQAESRAKGKPVDQSRVRQNQIKARLAEERMGRDERKRKEREANLTPPREPNIGGISTSTRAAQLDEQRRRATRARFGG